VDDYAVSWDWDDLVHGLSDYKDDTVDVLLFAAVRIVLLAVLLQLGVYLGTPKLDNLASDTVCPVAPLLINSGSDQLHELASVAKTTHLKSYDRQKSADVRKNVVIAVMFLVATAAQVYTGIKVISFRGHWNDGDAHGASIRTWQAALFFASIVVINCEAFIANRLVNTLTVEDGFYVPEFHQHRLFFDKRHGHTCDLCGMYGGTATLTPETQRTAARDARSAARLSVSLSSRRPCAHRSLCACVFAAVRRQRR
jgi:hypothetical protein